MSGANTVVELWGDQSTNTDAVAPPIPAASLHAPAALDTPDETLFDPSRESQPARSQLVLGLGILAFAWVALALYANIPVLQNLVGWQAGTAALIQANRVISIIVPPLILLALVWLATRGAAGRDTASLATMIARLEAERNALSALIAISENRLVEGAQAIYAQGEQLDAVGTATLNKIATLRAMLGEEIGQIGVQTNSLKNAAAAARSDMAVLLANLPKAQIETRKISEALQDAGMSAHQHAHSLAERLGELSDLGHDVKTVADDATTHLAERIAQMANQSAQTQQTLSDSQNALSEAETLHLSVLDARIDRIKTHIDAIGVGLTGHDGLSAKLLDRLRDGLADVEGRLAAIDTHGMERTLRLTDAIKALTAHSNKLRDELAAGGDRTHQLIADAEALMVALDASARELDETLPAALERVSRVTAVTHGKIAEAADQADAIATKINENAAALTKTERLLGQQGAHLDTARARIDESRAGVQAFNEAITKADADMTALTSGASVQLIEALLRVRETAQVAGDRARETITNVIPEAVATLGAASETAFREALGSGVKEQLAQVSAVAAQAVAAADKATERLMRQMLTISETSAAFAEQLSDADTAQENKAQTSLSRRVSLLIESLNSISIDVTKILSNEVTDAAWNSYLKGDRGIFTRRAVKLIDTAGVRDIVRHYDEDGEFRDHVNHYIHDFEAMLRAVLSSRESGPLSVTLLSSDMGKLYVALAHAIERLRT